jgi:hypothetical protein
MTFSISGHGIEESVNLVIDCYYSRGKICTNVVVIAENFRVPHTLILMSTHWD